MANTHGPIVLTEYDSAVLAYESDWAKYCRDNDIEDPFQKRMEIFRERLRPSVMPFGEAEVPCTLVLDETEEQRERMPTQAEYDLFEKTKSIFISRKLFTECGYEYFENYAMHNFPELLTLDEFKPCKSADGQCSLFCEQYNNCL